MKARQIRWVAAAAMIVLSLLLSGFVVELKPLTVTEGEGISKRAVQINNHGIKRYEEGKFHEALSAFVVASELDQAFWQAHYNCAVASTALGKFEEALRHLKHSGEIHFDNPLIAALYTSLLQKVNGNA